MIHIKKNKSTVLGSGDDSVHGWNVCGLYRVGQQRTTASDTTTPRTVTATLPGQLKKVACLRVW